MELQDIRLKIDEIDDKMAELFLKRMALVKEITNAKMNKGIKVSDPLRENNIINRVTAGLTDEEKSYMEQFFKYVFGLSKDYQKKHI